MSSEAAKNHGSLENWELRRANARDAGANNNDDVIDGDFKEV